MWGLSTYFMTLTQWSENAIFGQSWFSMNWSGFLNACMSLSLIRSILYWFSNNALRGGQSVENKTMETKALTLLLTLSLVCKVKAPTYILGRPIIIVIWPGNWVSWWSHQQPCLKSQKTGGLQVEQPLGLGNWCATWLSICVLWSILHE